jgi:hypothetical protein
MEITISRFRTHLLKNETHVRFHEIIVEVMESHDPMSLGIYPLLVLYEQALNDEITALDFNRKSALTESILRQDRWRSDIFRGLSDTVKGATKHFDPAQRKAAQLLRILFQHYGNITCRSLDDRTAAINDLLRELNQPNYAQAIAALGLLPWQENLLEENRKFFELMSERYNETAAKTPLRMRTARRKTDRYYQAILSYIESQRLVGIDAGDALIRALNPVIERFGAILAQERGARKAQKQEHADDAD